MYAKWNESDYKIRSLGLKTGREMNNVSYYAYQTQAGDLKF